MLDILTRIFFLTIQILQDAAFWMVCSFIIGGILHEFVPQSFFQKYLGGTSFRSLSIAVVMGMLLPMCSCGVIPLALSLYWSGASLAATLAFMAATPIINPAAAMLAFAMFGPELASIYLISGYILPMCLGFLALRFGGRQYATAAAPSASIKPLRPLQPLQPLSMRQSASVPKKRMLVFMQRFVKGVRWGCLDMGASTSKYILFGALLAGIILAITPQSWIQKELHDPNVLTIGATVLISALMYVCSIGHIPFVAALLASGASPGVGLTFLIAGVATNAPELLSMSRLISLRVAVLYALTLIACAMLVGLITNWLLMPDFTPVFSISSESRLLYAANELRFSPPRWFSWICMLIIIVLGVWKIMLPLYSRVMQKRSAV